jgi:Zn ribbon nucleic-acid-binding protein
MPFHSTTKSYLDSEVIRSIIARNGLTLLGMSGAIYGGNCPFCGRERSFTLWSEKGVYRCFWCGCDGRFVMSPERAAEEHRAKREMLAGMVA